jgi:hypothetical protein
MKINRHLRRRVAQKSARIAALSAIIRKGRR